MPKTVVVIIASITLTLLYVFCIIVLVGALYAANHPTFRLADREYQEDIVNQATTIGKLLDDANVKWTSAAGTALGCVRHRGPIPWDDDIDIFIHTSDKDDVRELLTKSELFENPTEANFGLQCKMKGAKSWVDLFVLEPSDNDGDLKYMRKSNSLGNVKKDSYVDFMTRDEWNVDFIDTPFGTGSVKMMPSFNEYLTRYYGKDYESVAFVKGMHSANIDWWAWTRMYKKMIK